MEWSDAVERNREALKRLVSSLVTMASQTIGQSPHLRGRWPAGQRGVDAESSEADQASINVTLPRHLHRAIVRLLRPAEAAARRLIITVARGLVVTLPPPRPPMPKPKSSFAPTGGTGIILPRGVTMPAVAVQQGTPTRAAFGVATSPQGGGEAAARLAYSGGAVPQSFSTADPSPSNIAGARLSPSPLRGGVRGGGQNKRSISLSFPLLDPVRLPRLRRPSLTSVPRISAPGFGTPFPIPVRRPPSRDDPLSARRLNLRLAALASALDDMPRQALRFARWKARRERERRQGIAGRAGPLRPGRPPGGRLKRWDPTAIRGRRIREVDDILAHAHALALVALEQRPDTS